MGAKWEGDLILQELYENESNNTKYIPVLLRSTGKRSYIPAALRPTTWYDLDADDGYIQLYRRLTDQPDVVPADLGPIVRLPPKEPQWAGAAQPSPDGMRIGFVDDLVPNEADIHEATRAVADKRPISIQWSPIQERMFETLSARRPDLRRQLADLKGVEEGEPMARSIEAFDLALGSASRNRDGAAARITPMWTGISESTYFKGDEERVFGEALMSFLVVVNAFTLSSLGIVLFEEDQFELPANIRPADLKSSMYQHLSAANALSYPPPFWSADTQFADLSFYVFAPKEMAIDAFRKGAGAAGYFMRKFLIPQTEFKLIESSRVVTYDPAEVRINKLRDENFAEVPYPGVEDLL
jgi:hypothetical protein